MEPSHPYLEALRALERVHVGVLEHAEREATAWEEQRRTMGSVLPPDMEVAR